MHIKDDRKNKQKLTKHYNNNNNNNNNNNLTNLRYFGWASSSCYTSNNRRVTLVIDAVIIQEWRNNEKLGNMYFAFGNIMQEHICEKLWNNTF
jgi:hypothetical protein